MAEELSWPSAATSPDLKVKIKNARVLCVGAGGIGCELLKTLALSGFEDITVVDMDTIDVSNLNRQFLFRKAHVGQPKATVAAESIRRFRPSVKITAIQGNIKESQFGVDFFRGFDIVLNGLDNVEARRHVNRLCRATEVPLVESGTEGYNGQVSVHFRKKDRHGKEVVTECYECQGKAAPKTYPVCTIRNTPDKPIHCVVWAKELLFPRLFGRQDVKSDLDESHGMAASGSAGEKGAAGEAQQTGMPQEGNGLLQPTGQASKDVQNGAHDATDTSVFLRRDGEGAVDYASRIFRRVFQEDIENVLKMEDLWKIRRPPTPLQLEAIAIPPRPSTSNGSVAGSASVAVGLSNPQEIWTVEENTQVFLESIRQYIEDRPDEVGAAVFDKDDPLAVDFVTATANLRSLVYGIPPQSSFTVKGMAGNIVHAIATTNAIVAGLIVIEAMKIIGGMFEASKMVWVSKVPSGNRVLRVLLPEPPGEPNPRCMVCGTSQLQLHMDTRTTTLESFINKVLKKRLSMNEPTIQTGELYYEEGEGLDDEEVQLYSSLLGRPLAELPGGGIRHGSIVDVKDQAQEFDVKIVVNHREEWDEEKEPDCFTLLGEVAGPVPSAAVPALSDDEDDDDEFEVVEVVAPQPKRKRDDFEASGEASGLIKKSKLAHQPALSINETDIIVLD